MSLFPQIKCLINSQHIQMRRAFPFEFSIVYNFKSVENKIKLRLNITQFTYGYIQIQQYNLLSTIISHWILLYLKTFSVYSAASLSNKHVAHRVNNTDIQTKRIGSTEAAIFQMIDKEQYNTYMHLYICT